MIWRFMIGFNKFSIIYENVEKRSDKISLPMIEMGHSSVENSSFETWLLSQRLTVISLYMHNPKITKKFFKVNIKKYHFVLSTLWMCTWLNCVTAKHCLVTSRCLINLSSTNFVERDVLTITSKCNRSF